MAVLPSSCSEHRAWGWQQPLFKTRLLMNCWLLVGSRIAFLGEEVADAANDGPK